jgi:phage-related protein
MSSIKKFIDKIAMAEARQVRDVLIPINDAKELRDEIMKLLLDKVENNKNEVIDVVVKGGKW